MSFAYRCMRCRTRNTFKKPLEDYVRLKKCKRCSWWRFYLDRARQYRTDYCDCAGYHYRHRIGSPFCQHHPECEFNTRVRRYGEDPLEVRIDIAWEAPPQVLTDPEPPF